MPLQKWSGHKKVISYFIRKRRGFGHAVSGVIENSEMEQLTEKVEFGFWEKYDDSHKISMWFVTVSIHRIYYNQFNKTKASHKRVTKYK